MKRFQRVFFCLELWKIFQFLRTIKIEFFDHKIDSKREHKKCSWGNLLWKANCVKISWKITKLIRRMFLSILFWTGRKKNSSWRSDKKIKMFGTLHHFISCFLKSCLAVKMCLKKSRMHCIPGLRKKKVNIVDHQSFYGHWTLLLFFIFEHRLILKSVLLWEEIIKYHP